MEKSGENETFEMLVKHKEAGIRFFKSPKSKKEVRNLKKLMKSSTIQYSDFRQGSLGDCALIAPLAALSQRPEFASKITPSVYSTNGFIKLHFKMFIKGDPKTVEIDDELPFDKDHSLVYAGSLLNDELYLASYFEKVFVKQACFSSYIRCVNIDEVFVYSLFSDCMISNLYCEADESKQTIIDELTFELHNKSSVVLGITPPLEDEPDLEVDVGHSYVVIDYDNQHNAVKLFDPRCEQELCVSDGSLPSSLARKARSNKGELWVTMDQLEKRSLDIVSLHSETMYDIVFQTKRNIQQSLWNKKSYMYVDICKVIVETTSKFMINLFSYTNAFAEFNIFVTTADSKRQKVELNFELPDIHDGKDDEHRLNGEAKTYHFQRFQLEPGTYIFSLEFPECVRNKEINFQMKIGSVSKCSFEELNEIETFSERLKKLKI